MSHPFISHKSFPKPSSLFLGHTQQDFRGSKVLDRTNQFYVNIKKKEKKNDTLMHTLAVV